LTTSPSAGALQDTFDDTGSSEWLWTWIWIIPSERRKGHMRAIKTSIAYEIYEALNRLGAGPELLAVIGSWGEGTLSDEDVAGLLKEYNRTGQTSRRM
jgi:hypothetical protein